MTRIHLSDRAKRRLIELDAGEERFLRIRVVPGGCSGSTYAAAMDDALDPTDETIYEDGDLRVVADRQSAHYVDGLRIDYSDDLIHFGFRLKNDKAAKSCGCGASFAALAPLGSAQQP